MLSNKPYLVRAFYEWIVDSGCTPYLMLDAEMPQVEVPLQYVEEGRIVLNVAPKAVPDLQIDNDALYFTARFSGLQQRVYAPISAVLAIYAMENGQGMVFDNEEEPVVTEGDSKSEEILESINADKPKLHIIE